MSRSSSESARENEGQVEVDDVDDDCSSCTSHRVQITEEVQYSKSVTIVNKPILKRRHGYRHRRKKKSMSAKLAPRISSRSKLEQDIMKKEDDFMNY